MNQRELEPPASVGEVISKLNRPQLYQIECSRCGAISMRDAAHDALRVVCDSCHRRLSLPTSITGVCGSCGAQTQYPPLWAGHSAACGTCGKAMMLDPVVGSAHATQHSIHEYHAPPSVPHSQPRRHGALREGAERSLILIVAGLATLIFIVAVTIL